MAEALAALSVAANIFQVISFSHECFILLKDIYKHGQPNPIAAQHALNLSTLSSTLKGSLTSDEKELHRLSDRCIKGSEELKHELEKVCAGQSKVGIFFKTLATKGKLERLEKAMKDNEEQLDKYLHVDDR